MKKRNIAFAALIVGVMGPQVVMAGELRISTKVIEVTSYGVQVAWKAEFHTDEQKSSCLIEIKFVDRDGFQVHLTVQRVSASPGWNTYTGATIISREKYDMAKETVANIKCLNN